MDIVRSAKRNFIWGIILKIYQILLPLIIRRVFIYRLGLDYTGLGGLFFSILSFLNIAEMGMESAVLFFMYKPVADNDVETVKRLLGLIRKCYKYVGLGVLIAGLAITPFIRFLIAGEVPAGINIYVIFLMNLTATVLSYWFYAYKETVLSVHLRNDLISRTRIGGQTIKYIGQLIVLLYFTNYYLYLAVEIVEKFIERLFAVKIADKKYPMYRNTLEPTPKMKKAFGGKIKALLFHKVGGIIVSSADPIVISAFLGLVMLGEYDNYKVIMSAVLGFVTIINTSSQAGIGHIIAANDAARSKELFDRYCFLFFAVGTVCCCGFLNLYQPVITLWINADVLLDYDFVIILCIYFYVFLLMIPGNLFENASGLWHKDRFRPLFEGVLNLTMNLIMVRFLGLRGVILSTVLSMLFFSMPWLYYNVIIRLFGEGFWKCILNIIKNAALCAAICFVSYLLCKLVPESLNLVVSIIIKGAISVGIPICVIYLIYRRSENWKWVWDIVKGMFNKAGKQSEGA